MGAGLLSVIKVGNEDRITELDDLLWMYHKGSFLPHGSSKSKFSDQQPIYITTGDENPAGATILVLVDGMTSENLKHYDRCLDLFDGTDPEAVTAARTRWKTNKDEGHTLTYWQQTEEGGWTKKA